MPEPTHLSVLVQRGGTPLGGGGAQVSPGAGTAREALEHPHGPVRSLYIHTPFCTHKCDYCDFYSFVDQKDQQGAFVERLIGELRALAPHAAGLPLRTIFVGGGTPSLLRVELWQRLLKEMAGLFDLSLIRSGGRDAWGMPEFTVECNPETTTGELLGVLKSGGVNRVSVGAQSFQPRHLKTLQRLHNPENVERAITLAREAGIGRQSIDLIYAIPDQTLEEWGADLQRGLALKTTHMSCYNLTYEPNTPMTNRLKRGEFKAMDEDLEAEMFLLTAQMLKGTGLERYEVSNYAVPGLESRHNLAYWLQEDWLAAGPSASGHCGGHRWKNVGNLTMYLGSAGYSPVSDHERPDAARAVRERLMTGLRLARGVEVEPIVQDAEKASPGAGDRLLRRAAEFIGDGLLEAAAGRWRVTERGWLVADFLAKRMMKEVS